MCLKLNPDKFELIYFNKSFKSFLLPSLALLPPSFLSLVPSPFIRSLGFILDAHLSLPPQILSVSKSCYFHLRRIKQLLPFLDDPTLQLSRIDYCNSLYFGFPDLILLFLLWLKLLILLLVRLLALLNVLLFLLFLFF